MDDGVRMQQDVSVLGDILSIKFQDLLGDRYAQLV